LRAPFRVAFYPLHLLANGVEGGIGFLGPRYLEPKAPHPPATGLRFAPAVRISGLDDIGLGPALKWGGDPPAPASLKASGTWSAIGHRGANAELRIPKGQSLDLRMSLEYDDKPNETYFGIGNGSSDENKSFFRLAHTDVDAIVRIGPAPRRQLRIGGGYSNMSAGRGSHAEPLLETVFTPAQAPFAGRAAAEWWYGVAGDLARLDDERDPSRGVHGRFDVRRAFGVRVDGVELRQTLCGDPQRVGKRQRLPNFTGTTIRIGCRDPLTQRRRAARCHQRIEQSHPAGVSRDIARGHEPKRHQRIVHLVRRARFRPGLFAHTLDRFDVELPEVRRGRGIDPATTRNRLRASFLERRIVQIRIRPRAQHFSSERRWLGQIARDDARFARFERAQ